MCSSDLGDPAVQALDSGDQVTDTLTVSTTDGGTQKITVTVIGSDDQVQIAGTATGTVTEDQQGTADHTALGDVAGTDDSAPVDQTGLTTDSAADADDALAPYLDLVGATDGGNGGNGASAPDDSASYLESVGVTPETAQNGASADAAVHDDASAVADADPFEAPQDADAPDPVQEIEGSPDDTTMIETPPIPDADIDQQHHG